MVTKCYRQFLRALICSLVAGVLCIAASTGTTACDCGTYTACPDETACRWQDGGQCKGLFYVWAAGAGHYAKGSTTYCGTWKPYVAFQGCPSPSGDSCGDGDNTLAHGDYILCP